MCVGQASAICRPRPGDLSCDLGVSATSCASACSIVITNCPNASTASRCGRDISVFTTGGGLVVFPTSGAPSRTRNPCWPRLLKLIAGDDADARSVAVRSLVMSTARDRSGSSDRSTRLHPRSCRSTGGAPRGGRRRIRRPRRDSAACDEAEPMARTKVWWPVSDRELVSPLKGTPQHHHRPRPRLPAGKPNLSGHERVRTRVVLCSRRQLFLPLNGRALEAERATAAQQLTAATRFNARRGSPTWPSRTKRTAITCRGSPKAPNRKSPVFTGLL